jgi:hypothetical protein
MKYSQWIGVAAAALVICACFLPWAFFPDLQQEFTGFYSAGNIYGKPGKVMVFFSVIEIALFLIPRVWAKRANLFFAALGFAFGVKSFILFSACYRGICPGRRVGLFVMAGGALIALVASCLPVLPVKTEKDPG